MKKYIILITALLVTACSSNPKTQITQRLITGNVVTAVMSSKDMSKVLLNQQAESSRAKCFEAQGEQPTDGTAQALQIMARALGKGIDCGAGYNDVLVNRDVQKTVFWDNLFKNTLGLGGLYLQYKGTKGKGPQITINNDGDGNQISTGNQSPNTGNGIQVQPVENAGLTTQEVSEGVYNACIAAGGSVGSCLGG